MKRWILELTQLKYGASCYYVKFLLSGLLNLPEPSAILSIILKEVRRNWSFAVRSTLLLLMI